MNIYQAIWDADLNGNGIRPILSTENRDPSEGYVVIDPNSDQSILKEVYIPDKKRSSYQFVERLFDNYTLNQTSKEKNTLNESKEVEAFLRFSIDSSPCWLAKQYYETASNQKLSDEQWYTYLYDLWFRQFNGDSGKDLSGFEHVFLGEQNGRKLVGHHFWYKYWLEGNKNQIEYLTDFACSLPNVMTVNYHVRAFDYKKSNYVSLEKKRCAFFVGLSAEGHLALGTVRVIPQAPKTIVIEGVHYQLESIMSPDGKSIRTFYPIPSNKNPG